MQYLKPVLYVTVLVSLIVVCTPIDAIAQDDIHPPMPCLTLDSEGRSIPWPCHALPKDDDPVLSSYEAAFQSDSRISRPDQDFIGLASAAKSESTHRDALFADRRQGLFSKRS
ncbi:MAG: hypothetical protein JXA73_13185 [Acidobacteria bacterium]|nr:hypothetical protein [Acidobacteriota bacterium]